MPKPVWASRLAAADRLRDVSGYFVVEGDSAEEAREWGGVAVTMRILGDPRTS